MVDQPLFDPNKGQFQSKNIQADVAVNTSSAERTLADLDGVVDKIAKKLGVAFKAATAENLQAQENFYKYIGDKDQERKVRIDRLKRAALDSVAEELKAAIAAEEEKKRVGTITEEELAKKKLELTRQTEQQKANIEAEAKKKGSPGLPARMFEGVQNVAGRVGGPIGGLVSGVANLVADPMVAIPAAIIGAIVETMNARAAFTQTGVLLRQAGLGGAGRGPGEAAFAGERVDRALFTGLNQALSQDEQRAILATASQSRFLTGQLGGQTGIEAVRGNLGLFANVIPDAAKEMELFTDASKSLGMSQKDLTKLFFQSAKSSKDLDITQQDAITTQLTMQKALRNITNDGTVAASVLDNVGSFFKEIGKSEAERQRFTIGVAQAGANMSLSNIAGMLAFARGIGPTSGAAQQAIFGPGGMLGAKGTGVFGLMGEFFTKVGGQFRNPMERFFAAEQLNQQFGLGLQTQDLPKFFDLAERLRTGDISQKKFSTDVEALTKQSRKMTIEGMDTLTQIVGPIQRLENVFTNFWTMVDERINQISQAFGHSRIMHMLGFGSKTGATSRNITIEQPDASHPTTWSHLK